MSADPRAALRERLVAMRADLVETMVRDGFSSGAGALLAHLAAALAALDEAQRSPPARENSQEHQPLPQAETLPAGPPARAGGEDYDAAADSLGSWREAVEAMRCRHRRAVVADDGEAIRLTLCGPAGAIGAVMLDAARAVALAGELIAAAHPRMMR